MIVSQPKAGTFLCVNLLIELGLEFIYRDYKSHNNYTLFDKNNVSIESLPAPRHIVSYNALDDIKDNQFGVCHLGPTPLLDSFLKILVTRDEDQRIESGKRYRRYIEGYRHIRNHGAVKWRGLNDVFEITFDDMIGENLSKIDNLQHFLFDELKFDSSHAIKEAKRKPSYTKSKKQKEY